jgi:hypothetical protein
MLTPNTDIFLRPDHLQAFGPVLPSNPSAMLTGIHFAADLNGNPILNYATISLSSSTTGGGFNWGTPAWVNPTSTTSTGFGMQFLDLNPVILPAG